MKEFEGKVALVTGGGSGIGRATALAFGREGAQVVIGNRNVQRGEETVSMIRASGGTASFRRTESWSRPILRRWSSMRSGNTVDWIWRSTTRASKARWDCSLTRPKRITTR